MAYHVDYDFQKESKGKNSWARRFFLSCCIFLLFSCFLSTFYPEESELLRTFLLPEQAETALYAAEVFSQELGRGRSVPDAARTFCMTLLGHGNTD